VPATIDTANPWHEGERHLQSRLGVEDRMAEIGARVIRDYMPDQHRELYARLPFIVLGSVDETGWPWATLLAGPPGFVHSPDPHTLDIHRRADASDPAWQGIVDGAAVGLLGIELHSRRRNRMNGTIGEMRLDGFTVQVEQAFGNCPQYIQRRAARAMRDTAVPYRGRVERLTVLDGSARELIRQADTFFVASYADGVGDKPHRQVDVSHRGGKAGFVRVDEQGMLTIPDFPGNRHFNTLGNLLQNPFAGLIFVDFTTGDLLQLSGEAGVVLDSPENSAFEGAERLWTLRPTAVIRRRGAFPLRFTLVPTRPT